MYIDIKTGLLINKKNKSQGAENVEYIPSPNCNDRPSPSTIDLLVIHNISLPKGIFEGEAITELFCNKLNTSACTEFATLANIKVSAHLLIRRDGKIIQYVPFNKRAWHAGISQFHGRNNCNDFSIGIEMEGTDNIAYEEIQYKKLATITLLLMNIYPHITPKHIVGHNEIAPTRKTDPGPAFSWKKYRTLLKKHLDEASLTTSSK